MSRQSLYCYLCIISTKISVSSGLSAQVMKWSVQIPSEVYYRIAGTLLNFVCEQYFLFLFLLFFIEILMYAHCFSVFFFSVYFYFPVPCQEYILPLFSPMFTSVSFFVCICYISLSFIQYIISVKFKPMPMGMSCAYMPCPLFV